MAIQRGGDKSLRVNANNGFFQKATKKAGKNNKKTRKATVLSFFEAPVRKLKARVPEGDQSGFYEHLKAMNLEGAWDRSSHIIKHKDCELLEDVELIRER